MNDVIILGSGPAGLTAALYTARAGKSTLVLSGDLIGGYIPRIDRVENYPGFIGHGQELADKMKAQAEMFGAKIELGTAKSIKIHDDSFSVITKEDKEYKSKALIIATGAVPRKLEIKGIHDFLGRGVSYCATCDGFFYTDKDVIFVGGGNCALNDALYLSNIAKTVKILYRKDSFARAEKVLVDRVNEAKNISVMWNTELSEIAGNESGVTHVITTKDEKIDCDGVFISIGHEANTDYLSEDFKRDEQGRLIPSELPTGIFVAGDVRSELKMQIATAVGTGCDCAMDAIVYLNSKQ